MAATDREFRRKLLATFAAEAEEHVSALARGLSAWESASATAFPGLLEGVFREAHSLKGAARAVGNAEVESLCQALESVFAACRNLGCPPATEVFDLLHRGVDSLRDLLSGTRVQVQGLVAQLENAAAMQSSGAVLATPAPAAKAELPRAGEAAMEPAATQADMVRVSAGKLHAVFSQAEQLLPARLAAGERAREWQQIAAAAARERRAPAACELPGRMAAAACAAQQDARTLAQIVTDLLEESRGLFLLPCTVLLAMFPKLVRDLCRDQGKQAQTVITGEDIEVDRRVLEEIKEPLIHLVRNAVDHGIEDPATRQAKGKPAQGRITIAVRRQRNQKVAVAVSDDGAGIDLQRLWAAVVKCGRTGPQDNETIQGRPLFAYLFESGVSTSPVVTNVSGRGLGLAIVREKVEGLGGAIAVESSERGTTFTLEVPVAMASFRGILVRAAGQRFVFPTVAVERVLRVDPKNVSSIENRPAVRVAGGLVALVPLADVLGVNGGAAFPDRHPALVVASAGTQIAFSVDEVVGEQEFLVKDLGPRLAGTPIMSGAAVMADGSLVLVLSAPDLLRAASCWQPGAPSRQTAPAAAKTPQRNLLVAEDSITARTLLKNILELAGYRVRTAVDGMDALITLRTEPFDLLVSDVDMPRMNGFELTARIRAEKGLAELPVVLVTALESRADRERGIEAGASAYIVKSSFDQSNLLEAIRRLL